MGNTRFASFDIKFTRQGFENTCCKDGIEKSVPRDHRLSSLGKPRDAKW